MADNINVPSSGATPVATDDVGGIQYQIIKLAVGPDGSATIISSANPVPTAEAGAGLTALQLLDNIVLLEDAAHASGDPGVMGLAVRKDTLATLAGTDGDYAPAQLTASGSLRVAIAEDAVGSILDADSVAKVTLNTKYIAAGSTDCTPKFAKIAAASNGNNTIIAAVALKKIRVLAYNFIANGTVNAKFQTAAGGTDLTGLKYCVVNGGICAPFNPVGWFETVSGELLNLNLSAAVAVGGEIVYIEV